MNSIVTKLIFAIALCATNTHAYKIDTELNSELDKAISQDNIAKFSSILLNLPADASIIYKGEELTLQQFMLKACPDIKKKLVDKEAIVDSINKMGGYTIAIYLAIAFGLLFTNDAKFQKELIMTRYLLFGVSGIMLGTMGLISASSQGSLTSTQKLELFMHDFFEKYQFPESDRPHEYSNSTVLQQAGLEGQFFCFPQARDYSQNKLTMSLNALSSWDSSKNYLDTDSKEL